MLVNAHGIIPFLSKRRPRQISVGVSEALIKKIKLTFSLLALPFLRPVHVAFSTCQVCRFSSLLLVSLPLSVVFLQARDLFVLVEPEIVTTMSYTD